MEEETTYADDLWNDWQGVFAGFEQQKQKALCGPRPEYAEPSGGGKDAMFLQRTSVKCGTLLRIRLVF